MVRGPLKHHSMMDRQKGNQPRIEGVLPHNCPLVWKFTLERPALIHSRGRIPHDLPITCWVSSLKGLPPQNSLPATKSISARLFVTQTHPSHIFRQTLSLVILKTTWCFQAVIIYTVQEGTRTLVKTTWNPGSGSGFSGRGFPLTSHCKVITILKQVLLASGWTFHSGNSGGGELGKPYI